MAHYFGQLLALLLILDLQLFQGWIAAALGHQSISFLLNLNALGINFRDNGFKFQGLCFVLLFPLLQTVDILVEKGDFVFKIFDFNEMGIGTSGLEL